MKTFKRRTPRPALDEKSVEEVKEAKDIIASSTENEGAEAAVRNQTEINTYTTHDLKVKEAELKSFQDDVWARKFYAGLIYSLVVVWLGLIVWIIIATGSGWYKLSDTVLVALITTTTLNVLGLFLVVTQYLFPKKT